MTKIKRTISLLLALVLVFGSISIASIPATAASNWPSLSESSYCELRWTVETNLSKQQRVR